MLGMAPVSGFRATEEHELHSTHFAHCSWRPKGEFCTAEGKYLPFSYRYNGKGTEDYTKTAYMTLVGERDLRLSIAEELELPNLSILSKKNALFC